MGNEPLKNTEKRHALIERKEHQIDTCALAVTKRKGEGTMKILKIHFNPQ